MVTVTGKWFGFVDIAVGICLVLIGIIYYIIDFGGLSNVLLGLYLVWFGAMAITWGLFYIPLVAKWMAFTLTFLGKGLFYFLLGVLAFREAPAGLVILSVVVMAVGASYFLIFQWFKKIPRPYPVLRGPKSTGSTASSSTTTTGAAAPAAGGSNEGAVKNYA